MVEVQGVAVPVPLIIDTDPGIDDAVALMLAAASPEVELLAITTVAGNVGIETTTRNALALKEFLRFECPVGRGAWRTLAAKLAGNAAHVHGSNGIGGWQLPVPAQLAEQEPALSLMSRVLRETAARGRKAAIVAIGPLTNIAQLLVADAAAPELIERIVVMGGGFGEHAGNITAHAEFNIHTDPEAAAIVFGSGVPVQMVGLNVTEVATVGVPHLPELFAHGGQIAAGMQVMLHAYKDTPGEVGVTAQHDSLALAAVVHPELLEFAPAHVEVVVEQGERRGATLVKLTAAAGSADHVEKRQRTVDVEANAQVAVSVDVAAFRELLRQRLYQLAQRLENQQ